VVEVGPVPRISASEYLLRINNANAPAGTKTTVHTHPGAEAFYVLSGRLSQKTPQGTNTIEAGQFMPGREPGITMEVSSTGTADLNALVMFVVDASKPFSSPSQF
jgi:quercetin dioxygenase-like cupin family protein